MESFGFDEPILGSQMGIPHLIWSNQQHYSTSDDYSILTGTVDLDDVLFSPHFDFGADGETVELSTPTTMDSIECTTSSGHVPQHNQKALWLPEDDIVGPPPPSFQQSPRLPCIVDPFCDLGEDFGSLGGLRGLCNNTAEVSTILSGRESTPNLSYCGGGGIASSGESSDYGSSTSGVERDFHNSNRNEAASRYLQQPHSNYLGSSDGRIGSKRKEVSNNVPKLGTSITNGSFQLTFQSPAPETSKRRRSEKKKFERASSIDFRQEKVYEPDAEAIAQVKEMIYRAAVMRPVNLGAAAAAEKPKRKNVRISSDPQTVAARQRRERIGERLRVLQKLVPGGSKMDTASMLDEAANYLKFLKSQLIGLEKFGTRVDAKAKAAAAGGASSRVSLPPPFKTTFSHANPFLPAKKP